MKSKHFHTENSNGVQIDVTVYPGGKMSAKVTVDTGTHDTHVHGFETLPLFNSIDEIRGYVWTELEKYGVYREPELYGELGSVTKGLGYIGQVVVEGRVVASRFTTKFKKLPAGINRLYIVDYSDLIRFDRTALDLAEFLPAWQLQRLDGSGWYLPDSLFEELVDLHNHSRVEEIAGELNA